MEQPSNVRLVAKPEASAKGKAPAEAREQSGGTTITMADLLEHVEKGGTLDTLIPSSLSQEQVAKKLKGRKLKGKPEEYEDLLKKRPPLPPNMKERNAFEPVFKERELKSLLEGSPNWTPLPSIQRDKRDPHFAPEGGLANFASLRLNQTTYGKAVDVAMRLIQLPFDKFTASEIKEAWSWVESAWDYQVTDGPVNGLYRRIHDSTIKAKPKPPNAVDGKVMREAIEEFLPFDPVRCYDMRGLSLKECSKHVILNVNSGSGYPWCKPKRDVIKEAYEEACQLLNAIAEGTVAKYAVENPELVLVQLKNKLDLYEWRDTKKSIRQYFVFPFHWTYLFSAVMQNASKGFVGFWENPRSMNAHGFSWGTGGGDRLYKWVLWAKTQPPGIYAIAYSDDQLWVIVCGDKSVYVITPDYKRMDMNLPGWIGRLAHDHLVKHLADKLDKTWKAILTENCRMAFDTVVIVGYSLVYRASNFLKSGVTGTAEFDQYASAAAFGLIRDVVQAPANRADAETKLGQALERVRKAIGLSVKPETMTLWEFKEDQEHYPWPFLGKTLYRFHGHYVPGSSPVRAVASMTSPKKKLPGKALIAAQLTRVRDIVASGGFVHRPIYEAARNWYETMYKLDNRPKDPLEVETEDINSFRKPIQLDKLWEQVGDRFPEFEDILNFYLPTGAQVAHTATGVTSAELSAQRDHVSLESALKDMYSEGGSWADEQPGFTDRSGQDKGDISIPKAGAIPTEEQGRVRPLPADVKAKYNQRLKELYREKLAYAGVLKGFSGIPTGPKRRRGRSSKFEQVVETFIRGFDRDADDVTEETLPEATIEIPEEVWEDFDEGDYADLDEEMDRRAYLQADRRRSHF